MHTLFALGEAFGKLPSELRAMDVEDLAFDLDVLIRGRRREREAVDDVEGERSGILVEDSREKFEALIAGLPEGSNLRAALERRGSGGH